MQFPSIKEVEVEPPRTSFLGHCPFRLIADISGQRRCNFRPGMKDGMVATLAQSPAPHLMGNPNDLTLHFITQFATKNI